MYLVLRIISVAIQLVFKIRMQYCCSSNNKVVIALQNEASLTVKHYGHMDPE
jgi:hypothetical protein